MTTCIFIRTYRNDLPWLKYCLRSIAKFVSGVDQIVIAIPETDRSEIEKFGLTRERIVYVSDNSYLWQQYDKMISDTTTECDYILHVDSDNCFMRPFGMSEMFVDSKPWMLITPYSTFNPGEMPWQPITSKILGFVPEFETMRRLPLLYPRWLYGELRNHVTKVHGKSLRDYVSEQPGKNLSEFNALGSYAHKFHYEAFRWIDTTKVSELPPTAIKQYWSYHGVQEEHRKEMEAILA